jgi:hypothetical protein
MFGNTLTAMSFQYILYQALEKLGYHWYESATPRTSEGMYQTSIDFQSTHPPTAKPMFTVYGKALPHRCEERDSALIRALIFIDESLGYKIGDVIYVQYLLLKNNIN